jgi:hypothetical protein
LGDGVLDGRRIVSSAAMAEMHSPQVTIRTTAPMRRARRVEHFPAYALGWQIMDYRGEPMLWHSGNADGMPSYMAILPKLKLGLAVMINTSASPGLHGAIASRIIDTYLGVPLEDSSGHALALFKSGLERDRASRTAIDERQASASSPFRPLADYAGTYQADLWGDVHVRLENGALTLQMSEGETADLAYRDHDTFLVTWRDPVFREFFYGTLIGFSASVEGVIDGLEMMLNRDKIEARRRTP